MVGSVLLLLICIIWGLIYLFSSLVRRSKELARTRAYGAERRAYEAKLKSKEYIAEQERIKEETIKGYEKLIKEAEENPDKNIWDNNYVDMRKVHFARLEKYGRSMFNGETYYIGSRGGIYTVSANGTRNYKY